MERRKGEVEGLVRRVYDVLEILLFTLKEYGSHFFQIRDRAAEVSCGDRVPCFNQHNLYQHSTERPPFLDSL